MKSWMKKLDNLITKRSLGQKNFDQLTAVYRIMEAKDNRLYSQSLKDEAAYNV